MAQTVESDKVTRLSDDSEKKILRKRLKDVEICVPIVYGTIAYWLGRKATETQSHKWTVYVRGATNEDLGVVIKRAVFQLHPSFNNHIRVVESPPFEVSECGWGEFEIGISLIFHNDVCEKQLNLYHHLKLYSEDDSGPQSIKKPVVVETYNEIVFPDPSEDFYARAQKHPAVIVPSLPVSFNVPFDNLIEKKGDTKDHPLNQWFINFSEADELSKLSAARQQKSLIWTEDQIKRRQERVMFAFVHKGWDEWNLGFETLVQAHIIKLRRQLSIVDGPAFG